MHPVRAEPSDWPAIRELLVGSRLPLDGAAEAFATGLVVRDGARLVGCAAIEPYEGVALLRSVAVVPEGRGMGLGAVLVHAAENLARDRGAGQLLLLTETAEGWFGRLGYTTIERAAVPRDVAASVEFETACSTSAVAMHRSLS